MVFLLIVITVHNHSAKDLHQIAIQNSNIDEIVILHALMVDSLSPSRAFTVGNDGGWFAFIVGKDVGGKFGRHNRK
ncbi:hypothetical protein CTM97_03755 [Photobacterium phosphoreum]|uniref:Uncharacterized protein n=1 Tax=Photobacterium phosphoreum TaxID=659 RepID=A0A2T3JWU9_PHOPO|nr:hypothetical protein CTM96_08105 [Photobacterium phosphoreum]PSU43481.1 hypothetical protein CTM97_03755 [Photobacterium phosphoreum]PSU53786.1 hypothetical protein C9J18_05120 [Photobacterium phosphoreum]